MRKNTLELVIIALIIGFGVGYVVGLRNNGTHEEMKVGEMKNQVKGSR